MTQTATTCAAAESHIARALRLMGIALLVLGSAVLAAATRPVIELPTAGTFLRLAAFVAALAMLASSGAAFWWREAALRRVEWAAYLGLALLLGEQFALGAQGVPAHSTLLIFALLVAAIVIARVTRRTRAEAAACKCG